MERAVTFSREIKSKGDAPALSSFHERSCLLLEKVLTIRVFEEKLLDLFKTGNIYGTTHSCVGQEAVPVAVMESLVDEDYVFSNHRGHGHYIAYGGSPELLLKELVGEEQGICLGRGGSQHLRYKNFFSNGITGGMSPVATGAALTLKMNGAGLSVLFIGDGALGQGVVYESLNLASLLELPVLFAIENNRYAMSTSLQEGMAGSFRGRAEAFGIPFYSFDTSDVVKLAASTKDVLGKIRSEQRPAVVLFETYRHHGHSKSDKCVYRSREEEASEVKKDCLVKLSSDVPEAVFLSIKEKINKSMEALFFPYLNND